MHIKNASLILLFFVSIKIGLSFTFDVFITIIRCCNTLSAWFKNNSFKILLKNVIIDGSWVEAGEGNSHTKTFKCVNVFDQVFYDVVYFCNTQKKCWFEPLNSNLNFYRLLLDLKYNSIIVSRYILIYSMKSVKAEMLMGLSAHMGASWNA